MSNISGADTLLILRILLEIVRLISGSGDATDEKIKQTRAEIKEAVKDWD